MVRDKSKFLNKSFWIFKSHGLDIKEQWICVKVNDEHVPLF